MKKPWLAFVLNFLIPGVGLAYLGQWMWAILNFVGAFVVAILWIRIAPQNTGMTAVIIDAISGSIAMQVAKNMNLKRETAPQPSSPTT